KSFSLNRRSKICPGFSLWFSGADCRDSSGKRQQRKELAAGKLDRAVFNRWRFPSYRKGRFAHRHFRRGGQSTDRAIGTRMEKSRCPFREKLTAAAPGRAA